MPIKFNGESISLVTLAVGLGQIAALIWAASTAYSTLNDNSTQIKELSKQVDTLKERVEELELQNKNLKEKIERALKQSG